VSRADWTRMARDLPLVVVVFVAGIVALAWLYTL
jgi:hypothetical protein